MVQVAKLSKGGRRYMNKNEILDILQNYNYYKVRLSEIPNEIQASPARDINSWIKSKNNVGKTVENQAIRLAENKEYSDCWKYVESIDELANKYERKKEERYTLKTYILNKYTKKAIGVNALIRKLQLSGYEIDRTKFYRIRDSICRDLEKMLKK